MQHNFIFIKLSKRIISWKRLGEEFRNYDRVVIDKNKNNLTNNYLVKFYPYVKISITDLEKVLIFMEDNDEIKSSFKTGLKSVLKSKVMSFKTLEKLIKLNKTSDNIIPESWIKLIENEKDDTNTK